MSDAQNANLWHGIPHSRMLNAINVVGVSLYGKALVAFRNSAEEHNLSSSNTWRSAGPTPPCTGIHVPSLPVHVPVYVSAVELLRFHSLPSALNHASTLRRHP